MASHQKFHRTISETVKSAKRRSALEKKAREKQAAEIADRVPGEGYEPCIVSFIDVLGFRDLLKTHHADDIRDILLHLRKFTYPDTNEIAEGEKGSRLISQPFAESVSDAVIRVRAYDTEYHDGAFYWELLDLVRAQIQCIGSGITIRGGMTVGDAHVGCNGKGPVFGPAVVSAYEIETCKAIYPRIVVDPSAYETYLQDSRLHDDGHTTEENAEFVNELLRIDTDERHFINYLDPSVYETYLQDSYLRDSMLRNDDHTTEEDAELAKALLRIDNTGGWSYYPDEEYRKFLSIHADLVRKKLGETKGRVREKFEWLAAYHNSVVEQKHHRI